MKKRYKLMILAVPAVLGLTLCLCLNLTGTSYIRLFPCFIFEGLGIACPGCGATRCICSILTFHFYDALKYNLAIFILFFYLAGVYVYCVYKVIRFDKFIKLKSAALWAIAAFLILFAVVRNLPFYPWHLESPYK